MSTPRRGRPAAGVSEARPPGPREKPAPTTIGRLLTATCSNCRMTSPVRWTSAPGTDPQVWMTKAVKRPSDSTHSKPSANIRYLLLDVRALKHHSFMVIRSKRALHQHFGKMNTLRSVSLA